MAIAQTDKGWRFVDPLNGYQDLKRRVLRVASPASFECDPVRTLRAVRMQFQFGCSMETETDKLLRSAVPLLKTVSAERVRDEWFKILQLADAAAALEGMVRLGLLHEVAPTFASDEDLCHALETVRATERLWAALSALPDPPSSGRLYDLAPHLQHRYRANICDERTYLAMLKCAALLHATGASGAALADRWKLSKREAELLHQAIHHHRDVRALAEQGQPSRRAVYRFFAETGEPGIDAAMLFLAHSMTGAPSGPDDEPWQRHAEIAARLFDAWFEHRDTQVAPTPLLSGREVIRELGQQTGPRIGEALRALLEEQAAEEVVNRQQALAYVRRWKTRSRAEN
jgi:tRNA nucleotidyltransferase/poly(A) polymerase